jgi:hypothetical protein
MNSYKIKDFNINKIYVFSFFYLTILIGFYFDENALGGAKHDFFHHYEISQQFNINFSDTFLNFGNSEMGNGTRNSPIFWIVIAFFNKLFPFDLLRVLNSLVSILIGVYLYKCLALKFKDQNQTALIFLTSVIFLSPTIRSLSIWPYNLIWGLFFFILSIYYFLKFADSTNFNLKFKFSLKVLFFLILSSYIHPSFAVFIIYYTYLFYTYFKLSKYSFYLFLFSLILSIPFFFYIHLINIFDTFYGAEGLDVSFSQSINLSNKIMVILTMFLFFIFPIINIKKTFKEIISIKILPLFIILFFGFLNIYFFNFPYYEGGAFGGGFFHKLSNILFKNNYFFYFIFIVSLFIIYGILPKNFDNFILLIILILSNPQFTIYNKYFDPLIFILFLTLFKLDIENHFFKKKYKFIQLYSLTIVYLLMALFKSHLYAISV